jgi:hypothetical protein
MRWTGLRIPRSTSDRLLTITKWRYLKNMQATRSKVLKKSSMLKNFVNGSFKYSVTLRIKAEIRDSLSPSRIVLSVKWMSF